MRKLESGCNAGVNGYCEDALETSSVWICSDIAEWVSCNDVVVRELRRETCYLAQRILLLTLILI